MYMCMGNVTSPATCALLQWMRTHNDEHEIVAHRTNIATELTQPWMRQWLPWTDGFWLEWNESKIHIQHLKWNFVDEIQSIFKNNGHEIQNMGWRWHKTTKNCVTGNCPFP